MQGEETMVTCEQVLQELSNFIDRDVDPALRAEIEAHLAMCHRCSVLHDTLRKVLVIVADKHTFEIPVGYSERLPVFLDRHL
jgi:predicted anti-sigma-YlaC factor YlaD